MRFQSQPQHIITMKVIIDLLTFLPKRPMSAEISHLCGRYCSVIRQDRREMRRRTNNLTCFLRREGIIPPFSKLWTTTEKFLLEKPNRTICLTREVVVYVSFHNILCLVVLRPPSLCSAISSVRSRWSRRAPSRCSRGKCPTPADIIRTPVHRYVGLLGV